ncbi:hypothetical protein [Tessaracoccus antarcticus]|nr:hypothetical protein [Tessaracoccus antarcticus]
MKLRSPLRNLLILPLAALTALSVMTSAPAAKADPISQDGGAVSDAAAPLAAGSMRLQKSNGVWVTITPQMQRNAGVVIDTIRATNWSGVSSRDKDRLIVISLMTMAQESTFFTNSRTQMPDSNNDVGPFQQRSLVGWYADGRTQAENIRILNDIPYATRTFIEGHRVAISAPGAAGRVGYIIPGVFQKKNWRTDEMWKVAADVQVPAAKYRYYYEYWRPVVEEMVTLMEGRTPTTVGTVNVYTTAGDHTVNGRKWQTRCEPYSKTIDRCTAKIWSTQVSRVDGQFVQTNAWNFNNLTYLPSTRADWVGNPLATHGEFSSQGRDWKTSCADTWTGPDACRAFIRTTVIESYLDSSGNRRFRDTEKWVFNNVVHFSD